MHIKRVMIEFYFIIKNIWEKLRAIAMIPFLLFFVILNIWNIQDYLQVKEPSKYFLNERILLLIPVGISCILILLLAQYIEGPGREFFYLNRKYIIKECMVETILYSILMSLEYVLFYRRIVGAHFEIYLKYICYIFAVSGFVVFLCYRIQKINIVIMILVLLYLVEIVSLYTGFLGDFCISSWNYYDAGYVLMILFFLIFGTVFWKDANRQIQLYSAFDK